MSKLSKILTILVIMFLAISFSLTTCYGIDLNVTNGGTTANSTNSEAINTTNSTNTNTTNQSNPNTETSNNASTNSNTSSNSTSTNKSNSTNTQSTSGSSSVTGLSNAESSDNSTIMIILNIALIVIGVLLIFFAIAILIRLGKNN